MPEPGLRSFVRGLGLSAGIAPPGHKTYAPAVCLNLRGRRIGMVFAGNRVIWVFPLWFNVQASTRARSRQFQLFRQRLVTKISGRRLDKLKPFAAHVGARQS